MLSAEHIIKEGIDNGPNGLNVNWFFRIGKYETNQHSIISDHEDDLDESVVEGSAEQEQQMARINSILEYFDCVEVYWRFS